MVSNMLVVRCTPPVKEFGATDTTPDRCVLLLLYFVVAAASVLLKLLLLRLVRLNVNVQERVASFGIFFLLVADYLQYTRRFAPRAAYVTRYARSGR